MPKTIPSFLLPFLERNPLQAGPLLTTTYDLTLSVGWIDTRLLEIGGWVVLIGHKNESDPLRAVLPIPIHTTSLKPSSLKTIFNQLSSLSLENLPQPFEPLAPSLDDLRDEITKSTLTKEEGSQEVSNVDTETPTSQAEKGEREGEIQEDQVKLDKETIYTSIVTPDSTVVYYKISKGIKKPADIPDE
ncbi:uncharacterized protein IL334_001686 [Kwoniella shivajii]|uniref:tRNA-splicing endonuclease subunit Sen15 domain-containing protein n=1 Tax=Kwoniella shivajii TaxID=564305 RepID=A0ABZ1CWT8_9TREE|nr:hypothetical protein IL334_001686 [Kwoniella shivajii]